MEEEEREVYLNQLTAEERSKNIKLTEKHCRQMMDLIYKKKMEYFKSGGDDWKEVIFVIVVIWRVFVLKNFMNARIKKNRQINCNYDSTFFSRNWVCLFIRMQITTFS